MNDQLQQAQESLDKPHKHNPVPEPAIFGVVFVAICVLVMLIIRLGDRNSRL